MVEEEHPSIALTIDGHVTSCAHSETVEAANEADVRLGIPEGAMLTVRLDGANAAPYFQEDGDWLRAALPLAENRRVRLEVEVTNTAGSAQCSV